MLQEIKDLQTNAVTKLISALYNDKREYTFKAPTGSGKTYMMADFMNRVLYSHPDVIFLVSTLSKGNLAQQNYEKFKSYVENGKFLNLNPYLINSDCDGEGSPFIPTDFNVYILPRDLYKEKSKLKKEGIFQNFLFTTTANFAPDSLNKKIFVIRDECHIETNNLNELSIFFDKIINFSATPKLSRKQFPDVEITNMEAEEVKLIKKVEKGSDEESLEDALNKLEEIKKDYINELKVNPCMIIQISNETKAKEEFENIIIPALNKHEDIKWVYISGEEKDSDTNDNGLKKLSVSKWKDYMKDNTSSISVIIFKMVISEGYDIPRACMLYQIRDSKSQQLNEQVMGRVRRNPRLLDFETLPEESKKLASTSWIWGILPENSNMTRQVNLFPNLDIEKSIKIKPTKLQNIVSLKNFNLQEYLNTIKKNKENIAPANIFELYRNLSNQENEIQKLCYEYSNTYEKWINYTENLSKIKSTFEKYICDYEKSMIVCPEVSFPFDSGYVEGVGKICLDDWVWCRKDKENKFSFDSEAETEWAEILKDIRYFSTEQTSGNLDFTGNSNKYLWGKNYPLNSEISFEYYLDGVHKSYPDFVMKDKRGTIHIFEVKSVNKSSEFQIDENEYVQKVNALKNCYKECSKKTKHIFYIPVLDGTVWKIFKFENGEERIIDKSMFIDSMKNLIAYSRSENTGELRVASPDVNPY